MTVVLTKSVAIAALLFIATSTVRAQTQIEQRIRPGDAVKIEVWRNAELSGTFDVNTDGTLQHPLYRELDVAGLTATELRGKLRSFLSRFGADPQFVAVPLVRVAVGGEVRQPSLVTLSPATTISQVVAAAGGATERANLRRVRLIREGRESVIDFTDPRSTAAWQLVQSGDQILVDRTRNAFREYLVPAASVVSAIAVLLNALTN